MVPIVRAALLALMVGTIPAVARGQAAAPAVSQAPAVSSQPPAAASAPPATDTAPAPTGSERPVVPATGYGWSTAAPRRVMHPRRARSGAGVPDAILPGFETLPDGSTRLFVMLTQPVVYDVKPARGTITYVLKGAYVDRRNNYNPLVTVHFNTPVTNARLVPHGKDLWFVVDLRADVTPAVTMDTTKNGGAMLRIDLPKGDYLSGRPAAPSARPAPSSEAPPTSP
jgi:hypothetical protein